MGTLGREARDIIFVTQQDRGWNSKLSFVEQALQVHSQARHCRVEQNVDDGGQDERNVPKQMPCPCRLEVQVFAAPRHFPDQGGRYQG